MDDQLTQRLARIESHLAHLEHQFDQLNQVVIEQGHELSRLKAWQQRLAQTTEDSERDRVSSNSTKPPHYR